MLLVVGLKLLWESDLCQCNNIMHYNVLQSVQTYVTFNIVPSYKLCLNYHESNFFLVQLVV